MTTSPPAFRPKTDEERVGPVVTSAMHAYKTGAVGLMQTIHALLRAPVLGIECDWSSALRRLLHQEPELYHRLGMYLYEWTPVSPGPASGLASGKTEAHTAQPRVNTIRIMRGLYQRRLGESGPCGWCIACAIERMGCGCDGSYDDGCFLCTPRDHKRPECLEMPSLDKIAPEGWAYACPKCNQVMRPGDGYSMLHCIPCQYTVDLFYDPLPELIPASVAPAIYNPHSDMVLIHVKHAPKESKP